MANPSRGVEVVALRGIFERPSRHLFFKSTSQFIVPSALDRDVSKTHEYLLCIFRSVSLAAVLHKFSYCCKCPGGKGIRTRRFRVSGQSGMVLGNSYLDQIYPKVTLMCKHIRPIVNQESRIVLIDLFMIISQGTQSYVALERTLKCTLCQLLHDYASV